MGDQEDAAADDERTAEQGGEEQSRRDRLKAVYGISKLKAENLVVAEGETVSVSLRGAGAERYKRFAHRVPIQSVDDLKRVIGVPDEVAANSCRCVDLSEAFSGEFERIGDLSPSQREQLRAATDAYVHGNSKLVSHYAAAIDKGLALVNKAAISVVGFLDITVERNAVLNVSPSVDVIVARNVLIKLGGKIRFTSRLKIDCSSIRGEESLLTHGLALEGVERALAAGGGGQ